MGIENKLYDDREILIISRLKKPNAILIMFIMVFCFAFGLTIFKEPSYYTKYVGFLAVVFSSYIVLLILINIFYFRFIITEKYIEKRIGWPWPLGIFNSTKCYPLDKLSTIIKFKSNNLPFHTFNLYFEDAALPVSIGSSITNLDEILCFLESSDNEIYFCDNSRKYLDKLRDKS